MFKLKPFTLTVIISASILVLVLLLSSRSELKTVEPAQPDSSETSKPTLETRVAHSNFQPIRSSAGFTILDSADTKDVAATDAFLRRLASTPEQLKEMQEENAFVTRRQLVKLDEGFPEIAARIAAGEDIKSLKIPDFDGGSLDMDISKDQTASFGPGDGTLVGGVRDEETSDVVIGYYGGESYAYVNIPTKDRAMEYQPCGERTIILAEIDTRARNRAQPCALCQQGGADHGTHERNAQSVK